jgi:hypothetical protein
MRSSAATVATPSGMPIPRLITPSIGNSNAQRRAISLRSLSSSAGKELTSTRI